MNNERILDPISWLIDKVVIHGFEFVFKRYYGVYTGKVIDVNDPEKRNRVRVFVPDAGYETAGTVPNDLWAESEMMGFTCSGDNEQLHGMFFPPEKGDYVWVRYIHGDLNSPIYGGGWLPANNFKGSEDIIEENNLFKGLRTKAGHLLKFSDKDGNIDIKLIKGDGSGGKTETEIILGNDKSILLRDQKGKINITNSKIEVENSSGSNITVDGQNISIISGGDTVKMSGSLIEVSSGSEVKIEAPSISLVSPNIKMGTQGNLKAVLTADAGLIFNTHTHLVTAIGLPSSIPVVPITPANGISLNTKTT